MKHNAPKQHRSEATFERIVAAAERLFRLRRTVEVAVREICEEAGASRSSFYARFPDSDALVHVCYDRFRRRVTELYDGIERDWPDFRPGGDDLPAFAEFLVTRCVEFWHGESRLVQAFRAGEAYDSTLRAQREALDRVLVVRSRAITCRHYADLDEPRLAAALDAEMTVLAAAFRSALDFPEQLTAASPEAQQRLVSSLTGLILRAVAPSGGAPSAQPGLGG